MNKLKISDICKLHIITFMYKFYKALMPSAAVCTFYKQSNFVHVLKNYNTRQSSHHFIVPFARSDVRKFCVSCVGPVTWNDLPFYIVECDSVIALKRLLTKFALNQYL